MRYQELELLALWEYLQVLLRICCKVSFPFLLKPRCSLHHDKGFEIWEHYRIHISDAVHTGHDPCDYFDRS